MMQSAPALSLALVSVSILGFRHGFDYDHAAAILDIASVQSNSRSAMKAGLLYALGHAATVAALGMAVIVFQFSLPPRLDVWMEHAVGITLLVLGCYVLLTTFFQREGPDHSGHSHDHNHVPGTRVTLIANAILWPVWRLRSVFSGQPCARYKLFGNGIGNSPALLVGVIHGLGAETPSQLMLFLLAARLGGIRNGLFGLMAFLAGMLIMNTLMCAAATGILRISVNRRRTFQWFAGLSAAYSIVAGMIFLAGTATVAAGLGQ